jgi:hypothetical protein
MEEFGMFKINGFGKLNTSNKLGETKVAKPGEVKIDNGMKPLNFNPGSMMSHNPPSPPTNRVSIRQPYGSFGLSVTHDDIRHAIVKNLERFNDVEHASGSISLKLKDQGPKTLSFVYKKSY